MDFKDSIKKFSERIIAYKDLLHNEEQTKDTLIKPFVGLMGFDCSNPLEVKSEVQCDEGIKKGLFVGLGGIDIIYLFLKIIFAFLVYLPNFSYLRTSALAFIFPNASQSQFPRSYFGPMQPILQTLTLFIRKLASPYYTTLILTIRSKLP